MPYYVVNTDTGRGSASGGTHIMKSNSSYTSDLVNQVVTGYVTSTLCDKTAGRYAGEFTPSEASCRVCQRRWQLAVQRETSLTPEQRERESDARQLAQAIAFALVLFIALVVLLKHH